MLGCSDTRGRMRWQVPHLFEVGGSRLETHREAVGYPTCNRLSGDKVGSNE